MEWNDDVQLIMACSLMIASKLEEVLYLDLNQVYSKICQKKYSKSKILKMEV